MKVIASIKLVISFSVFVSVLGCSRMETSLRGSAPVSENVIGGAGSNSHASSAEAPNRRLLRAVVARVLPQPVAHRGVTRLVNENSLESIVLARTEGVGAVELDVRPLQDEEKFIIFHDRRVRTLNAEAPDYLLGKLISDLRVEDIGEIKVPRAPNVAPPFLREALLSAAANEVVAFLDIKGESVDLTSSVIERVLSLNAQDVVIVQSQHLDVAQHIREAYPDIPVLVRTFCEEDVFSAISLQPAMVQVDLDWATKEVIRALTARGIPTLAKTLAPMPDNKESWCRAWQLGISLILTDRPGDLVHTFSSMERAKSLCSS